MAKRIRKTITVSESDYTPRPRRKKRTNAALIVIVLALIGLFLLSRTHEVVGTRSAPASSHLR